MPPADGAGGRRLGRGLKALISVPDDPPSGGELVRIPVSRIRPNPFQPRKTFNPEELADLESSLAASGLRFSSMNSSSCSVATYSLSAGKKPRLTLLFALGL